MCIRDRDYIDPDSTGEGYGQAPIGARCYVSAATGKAVAVSCTVSKLNTQDADETVTAAVKAAIADYLAEIAFEQDFVSYGPVSYTHLDVYKRQFLECFLQYLRKIDVLFFCHGVEPCRDAERFLNGGAGVQLAIGKRVTGNEGNKFV